MIARLVAASIFLAGCAGDNSAAVRESMREAETARTAEIAQLSTARDTGKISWRQWSSRAKVLLSDAAGPARQDDARRMGAAMDVVAERVDTKHMTPAEGRLALTERFAALEAEHKQRIVQLLAATSTPSTTRCSIVLNEMVCRSY